MATPARVRAQDRTMSGCRGAALGLPDRPHRSRPAVQTFTHDGTMAVNVVVDGPGEADDAKMADDAKTP
ncbi:hypothetical protein SAMN05444365_11341 [Micromonospora pattaloongensis]|uniref:Uncharacterized protein n=1 Tax=Micromonospora pattaloongensis TaxID=405436 RepID=A0A1H3SQT7_9ACTN|nr:hypothetical protein SAMN05444365_11341 [Micromonospora pattaloongensis]